jgi:hypothetical protein
VQLGDWGVDCWQPAGGLGRAWACFVCACVGAGERHGVVGFWIWALKVVRYCLLLLLGAGLQPPLGVVSVVVHGPELGKGLDIGCGLRALSRCRCSTGALGRFKGWC